MQDPSCGNAINSGQYVKQNDTLTADIKIEWITGGLDVRQ